MAVLAVDALVVKLSRRSLDLAENLEHIRGVELPSSDEGQQEATVRSESPVESQFHHQALGIRKLGFVAQIERQLHKEVFC